jgi:hypothetical protein
MSREKPAIYVMRQGDTLRPEFEADAEWIRRQPTGTRIKISLHSGRSPARLGLYWSLLGRLVRATDCAPTAEALHEAIKLDLGFVQRVRLKGMTVLVPGSVAFDKMTEAEFGEYLERAIEWMATNYGVTPDDLLNDNKER